jgi:hypothetical protein
VSKPLLLIWVSLGLDSPKGEVTASENERDQQLPIINKGVNINLFLISTYAI